MEVRVDPEHNETRVLFDFVGFDGKQVLEIGSGDGRLTWLFADRAKHVTAIEPYAPSYEQAMEDIPRDLRSRVDMHNIAFLDYAAKTEAAVFDIVLLSWALC